MNENAAENDRTLAALTLFCAHVAGRRKGVYSGLREPEQPLPGLHNAVLRAIPGLHRFGVERVGRSREEVLADIRDKLGAFPRKALEWGRTSQG